MMDPTYPANMVIEALLDEVEDGPEAKILDLRVGPFWTVVHTTCGAGMASTMRSESHLHGSRPVAEAGSLLDLSTVQAASLLRSSSAPQAAVGLATVNALLAPRAAGLEEKKAVALLEEKGAGRTVAMIGRFPFADALRERCGKLMVFERGLNRRAEDFGDEALAQLLPEADVVAVTATTLLNRTLPSVLAAIRPDAYLMMLGPSTPLTPALFRFGFDVLCGTVVVDPESVLLAAGQGATTPQITGVRRVSMWRDGG